MNLLVDPPLEVVVRRWYGERARDLPWRRPGTSAWAVLVSEFMLQQTPVARVEPVYEAWLRRWPTPAALADEPAGEAVREWGRLGYPRRALRLHAAAVAIDTLHGGAVPSALPDLLALPGVGAYTARAVAAFAHRQRHAVLDTNVRRVLARCLSGRADAPASVTAAEWALAESVLPGPAEEAATYSVAIMELGALVCTARAPRCTECPLASRCAWQAAGRPPPDGPARRPQSYAGTDRQVRGRLLAVLREAEGPVPPEALTAVWADDVQRERSLAGLLEDGLVERAGGSFSLPGL
ncbi:MAG: A/G-specific adenine glycosylase [Frankiales bacterium]|jgi:A/G-specific adenine glycosylase|nr:A/G-specific adenine glycosylase [Frankiales bacterium]